jgi:hypothetical protein
VRNHGSPGNKRRRSAFTCTDTALTAEAENTSARDSAIDSVARKTQRDPESGERGLTFVKRVLATRASSGLLGSAENIADRVLLLKRSAMFVRCVAFRYRNSGD